MTNNSNQRREQHSKIKRQQEERDYVVSTLLGDPKGREYLWWLLAITKVNANPFAGNALTTSFACGEMNVGQQILAHILEVNPAGYVQMLKERLDDHGNHAAADNRSAAYDSDDD